MIEGVIEFSHLTDPIVLIELTLFKVESGDGASVDQVLLHESLLDSRLQVRNTVLPFK